MNIVFEACILASSLLLATGAYRNTDFEFFVYAQQWPTSVCTQSNITHRHVCAIPKDVNTWSVHGLWPSSHHGQGPSFCNRSLPFSEEKISSIEKTLSAYWPNLYTDEPKLQFWAHEWNKHGTCAASVSGLGNELAYFNRGLALNRKFDLLSILQTHSILPSDTKLYSYDSIIQAFTDSIGSSVNVQCYYDRKQKIQYLLAVQVCTDKLFNAIDCTSRYMQLANNDQDHMELDERTSFESEEEEGEFEDLRRTHYRGSSWCNPQHNVAYGKLHHAPCASSED